MKWPAGTPFLAGSFLAANQNGTRGHHRVIEALPYVMHEIAEAHLLILGSGPFDRAQLPS
jgi:hypothetical protein